MNSLLGADIVTFGDLRKRLITQVKRRIDNGEFSERALARMLGTSQSQTHNVLKGTRKLQIQLADQILAKLGISTADLLAEEELDRALKQKLAVWDAELANSVSGDLLAPELNFQTLFGVKMPPGKAELTPRTPVKKAG